MRNRYLILRIVIVAFLLYSMTAFGSGLRNLRLTQKHCYELENELTELREENKTLKLELSSEPDDEIMGKLAREKLGMLKPGDKIFIFSKDREELLWSWK